MHPIFRTATAGAGAGAAKGGTTQTKLYGNVIKTESAHLCHIAIADFIAVTLCLLPLPSVLSFVSSFKLQKTCLLSKDHPIII